jgi:hypothetical protein
VIPDPNRLLDSIRELINAAEEEDKYNYEMGDYKTYTEDGNRLSDLIAMLDEWLSKGGALPEAWRPVKSEK